MVAFSGPVDTPRIPMEESVPAARRVEPARRIPTLADDVRRHLLEPQRTLPPKYFYDQRGSELFDRICDTPEYYPTRTEQALLEASAAAIVRRGAPEHLFELGSGTSRKTRVLLDACQAKGVYPVYWPLDVSEGILLRSADELRREYPWLTVNVLVGDYSGGFGNLPSMPGAALVLFLGGTIGNFTERDGAAFLAELGRQMDTDDHLLVGFDRVKDRRVLEAAYNDEQGLTAAFNRNMLRVMNRELGADFDLRAFDHRAVFNDDLERIEMYLVPGTRQVIHFRDLRETLELAAGEAILTEISRKFTRESLERLLEAGGFELVERFDAPDEWYSLALARKR